MNAKIVIPAGNIPASVRERFAAAGHQLVDGLDEARIRTLRAGPKAESDAAIKAAMLRDAPGARAMQALGFPGQFPVDAEVIDAADDLEVIFMGSAGYDQVDVAAATRRGVLVVTAPGGNAPGVAERAMAFILALGHKLGQSDRYTHEHRAAIDRNELKETFPPLVTAFEKTLGLIGYGQIGRRVARMALALDMQVIVYDPYLDSIEPADPRVRLSHDLAGVLGESDFVSVHAPLVDATRGLIGREAFSAMKPSAFLINTSRGPLVDTDALVEALAERRIYGAGLDVTEPEPLPPGHPLFAFDNVLFTPHSAGSPAEMIERCALQAAEGAIRILAGSIPDAGIVNRDAIPEHRRRFGAGS